MSTISPTLQFVSGRTAQYKSGEDVLVLSQVCRELDHTLLLEVARERILHSLHQPAFILHPRRNCTQELGTYPSTGTETSGVTHLEEIRRRCDLTSWCCCRLQARSPLVANSRFAISRLRLGTVQRTQALKLCAQPQSKLSERLGTKIVANFVEPSPSKVTASDNAH